MNSQPDPKLDEAVIKLAEYVRDNPEAVESLFDDNTEVVRFVTSGEQSFFMPLMDITMFHPTFEDIHRYHEYTKMVRWKRQIVNEHSGFPVDSGKTKVIIYGREVKDNRRTSALATAYRKMVIENKALSIMRDGVRVLRL